MRYEVAVETLLAFQEQPFALPFDRFRPETVVIEFEGRRYVWHAIEPDDEGNEYWPTVTTVVADSDDYAAEREAMERFLSALAFQHRRGIEGITYGGAGWPAEMDPPVARAYRRGLASPISDAPREVVMIDDDRLRVTLAHYREGLNTSSPFFGFLAFWNALDVACEDHPGRLQAWVQQTAGQYWHLRTGDDPAPADIWDYLKEASRNAVAHAVRHPGRPALDPDAPEDRTRLSGDKRLVQSLVDTRLRERWGDYAVYERRRDY